MFVLVNMVLTLSAQCHTTNDIKQVFFAGGKDSSTKDSVTADEEILRYNMLQYSLLFSVGLAQSIWIFMNRHNPVISTALVPV
jgi:hypothetical protein